MGKKNWHLGFICTEIDDYGKILPHFGKMAYGLPISI